MSDKDYNICGDCKHCMLTDHERCWCVLLEICHCLDHDACDKFEKGDWL